MTRANQEWTERVLQEGDRRFRSLIENATDIIVILDEHGIFRYCSPSAERLLGYRLDEIIGHAATEFVHPEDVETILRVLYTAIQNPGISQPRVEYRVRHHNTSWRSFEAVATNLLGDPAIQGVVINCHDITDRKRVEAALRSANRQIANILESITDAFISLDQAWCFTYLNQRAAHLLQRSPKTVLHQNFWDLFPEFVGTTLEQECHLALANKTPSTFDEFYPTLQTWFEVRVFPASNGLSIFLVDITQRQQAQAELLEMSTALGNAVEGIARLNPEGRYIALNRAYAEALGYDQAEMIGLGWQATIYPDDQPLVEAAYHRMQQEGKADVEVRAVRKDHSMFYKEVVMVAAYDWYDQYIGYHYFTRDITERKAAEVALRQQAEQERLMAGLAQLSAGIAHRIRQSLDLAMILNTTVSEVRQFLQADRVVIYRCDSPCDRRVVAESVHPSWASILGINIQDASFYLRYQTYRQGQNLVVDDLDEIDLSIATDRHTRHSQVQAFLAVPILHDNELWGILVAHQCTAPRHWQSYEIGLLEQLASQVAIAIQQSELFYQIRQLNTTLEQQVQERTNQLEQALHYEATLKRITDAVRDSLDEDQILQTAVQELAIGLQLNGCDAALYDLDREVATIQYEYLRVDMNTAKGVAVAMQDYAHLYRQLLNAQLFQFCRLMPAPLRPRPREHMALACPIVDNQKVLGDLWLFKPCTQVFSELEIRLIQQVANQCAIAIRQARLYQATQAQVIALENLNQLKDDFLSTVSHELRTPMSNMKMAIHLLRNVTTPERQTQYLDILQAECIREIELINDLLDLQRLEADAYSLQPCTFNLSECLTALIYPFQARTRDRQQQLELTIAEETTITVDRATLERILAELLNNACKYTGPNGAIQIHVATTTLLEDRQPATCFQIANQAEIPADQLSQIFNKFYRVPNGDRWKQGGTGLGLALVQRLIHELQGSIQVSSSQGWTQFTVLIPHKPDRFRACPLAHPACPEAAQRSQ